MPWPTTIQYSEAMQNPRISLTDPELKAGNPVKNKLGLPVGISGTFAVVYQVQCVGKIWAVKCFLHESVDMQQRYLAIAQHLQKASVPYTVGFEYQPSGIKIGNQHYPILKMEWIQGDLLDAYIRTHLQYPTALINLANRWVIMAKRLQQSEVAHGDLQHANVMVVNGSLKLIDYDGMFVPALANNPNSDEKGHPNYQHPRRKISDFGSNLDNFSLWLIYLSLVALSIDPGIWLKVNGGDEYLILREEDLKNPSQSKVLKMLDSHTDARIRDLTSRLCSFLNMDPCQIPTLNAVTSLTLPVQTIRQPVHPQSQPLTPIMSNPVSPQSVAPALQNPIVPSQSNPNQPQASSPKVQPQPVSSSQVIKLSRREILAGLVGIAAGSSLTWLATTQGYHLHGLFDKKDVPLTPTPKIAPGTTLITYRGHKDAVDSVTWSPDGRQIVSTSTSSNGNIQLWIVSPAVSGGFGWHRDITSFTIASWSPDGKYIASGGKNHPYRFGLALTIVRKLKLVAHIPERHLLRGLEIASILPQEVIVIWKSMMWLLVKPSLLA
jgi:tRNA A-37 threonylcarbamoyl transferase component Bud32